MIAILPHNSHYMPTIMLWYSYNSRDTPECCKPDSVKMIPHMQLIHLLALDWYRYESDSVFINHKLSYMIPMLTMLTIIHSRDKEHLLEYSLYYSHHQFRDNSM
jgi:hypothetical protein